MTLPSPILADENNHRPDDQAHRNTGKESRDDSETRERSPIVNRVCAFDLEHAEAEPMQECAPCHPGENTANKKMPR